MGACGPLQSLRNAGSDKISYILDSKGLAAAVSQTGGTAPVEVAPVDSDRSTSQEIFGGTSRRGRTCHINTRLSDTQPRPGPGGSCGSSGLGRGGTFVGAERREGSGVEGHALAAASEGGFDSRMVPSVSACRLTDGLSGTSAGVETGLPSLVSTPPTTQACSAGTAPTAYSGTAVPAEFLSLKEIAMAPADIHAFPVPAVTIPCAGPTGPCIHPGGLGHPGDHQRAVPALVQSEILSEIERLRLEKEELASIARQARTALQDVTIRRGAAFRRGLLMRISVALGEVR